MSQEFVIIDSGQVLSTLQARQYAEAVSNSILPEVLTEEALQPFGMAPVSEGIMPVAGVLEEVQRDGVELIDGLWVKRYRVVPKFTDDTAPGGKTQQEKEAAYRAELLQQRREELLRQVEVRFLEAEASGLTYAFPDGTALLQTGGTHSTNVIAQATKANILIALGRADETMIIIDSQDNLHFLTPMQMQTLALAVSEFQENNFKVKQMHTVLIGLWDGEEPYDIEYGWPSRSR